MLCPSSVLRPVSLGRQLLLSSVALVTTVGLLGFAPVLTAAQTSAVMAASTHPASAPRSGAAAAATEARSTPVDKLFSAVVRIESQAPEGAMSSASLGRQRTGTGVVIDERTVLTIGYLILETDSVDILTPQGRKIPAAVAGYDHQTGFGLVRAVLPLGIDPLELGDSDAISERSRVLTLGQGEREITELMVVSRKPFSGSWEYFLERPFYTFPPVNNWSGAALFGRDGKLIGIGSLVVNDAASDRAGVPGNLYVPVNLLKPILADLQSKGRRAADAQPWLGINVEPVHGNLVITRVQSGSPADRAGISSGAVVLAVAGEKVADREALFRRIRQVGPAGTALTLQVLQQGGLREIEVRSIDRADFLQRSQRGRGI